MWTILDVRRSLDGRGRPACCPPPLLMSLLLLMMESSFYVASNMKISISGMDLPDFLDVERRLGGIRPTNVCTEPMPCNL